MAEQPKKHRQGKMIVWGVLGLLVISLGGFGIGNFGGTIRTIGAVGDTEITVNDYALALQAELRDLRQQSGRSVSLASPEGAALAARVQRQLIAAAALEQETRRLGLSVGDTRVRDAVLSQRAFRGLDGNFDREAYAGTLRRNGITEEAYEADIRAEAATRLATAAVLAGTEAPGAFVDAFAAYAGERRDIAWLRLGPDALAGPLPQPGEADLQATYEADPETYTEPERKRLTYAVLTPEALVGMIEVDETALRALYDDRAEEFNRPERRLVERLVFPDRAAAQAARDALDAGSQQFEALVTGRGLALADVDLGDVTEADLGAAGAAVFAPDAPGIVGPAETALGPALFRVNAVLQAQRTEFEEVRDELTDELALDRARREIDAMREAIDDLLAGGATLEELAAETEMELGTIELGPETADGIAGYAAFRDAAGTVAAGDFPELLELEDGGLFALRLDAILPPALLPLEDVRDRVAADWRGAEIRRRLMARAAEIQTARARGESFADLGFAPEIREGIARASFLDGAPDALIETAFTLGVGETALLAGPDAVHLVEVTAIITEDPAAAEAAALREAVAQGVAQSLAQDTLDRFVRALEDAAEITRNPAAINAVHAQFP